MGPVMYQSAGIFFDCSCLRGRSSGRRFKVIMSSQVQADARHEATDPCMDKWKQTVESLKKIVDFRVTIQISRAPGSNLEQHWQGFHSVFQTLKAQKKPCLLINHNGQLCYQFRGESAIEPAEVIGVPSEDVMIYISNTGRRAMTGTNAVALGIAIVAAEAEAATATPSSP